MIEEQTVIIVKDGDTVQITQKAMVMAGRSVHLTTLFPGQA